ncbi:MAG: hypothetical protein RIS94_3521, partial [Pseudomonadota bacterium]
MVALYHAPIEAPVRANALVGNGYLYVDFFFVLSGFVIAHAWADRLRDAASARAFLIRRWGRLWPLHVATLAFLLALECTKAIAGMAGLWHGGAFLGGNTGWTLFTNLLLIHAWGLHSGIYWNFPSWSVSTEWAAYLVFAAVTLLAGRFWIAAMAAVGLAAGVAFFWLSPARIDATFDYGVLRCVESFALGTLVHLAWQRFHAAPVALATTLQVISLAIVGWALIRLGTGKASHLVPLPFALAVFAFALPAGALAAPLGIRPLRALGDWSYSIYLNHIGVVMVMKILATATVAAMAPSWMHMRDDALIFSSGALAN